MNWELQKKEAKQTRLENKYIQSLSEFLKNYPEDGFMLDGEKVVNIEASNSSALRRFVKLLDKYYYLATELEHKDLIVNKKKQVEIVLAKRPDATVEEARALKAKERAKRAREKAKKEREKEQKLIEKEKRAEERRKKMSK